MPVTNIPDDHHVVRFCPRKVTIRKDGIVIGIQPSAFAYRPANPPLRPKPEEYLSGVYYEHFAGNPKPMKDCCAAIPFPPKDKDALVRLHVGKMKKPFLDQKVAIRVTHEGGGKHHAAYAAIRPRLLNELLAAKIISEAVVELKEVKNL